MKRKQIFAMTTTKSVQFLLAKQMLAASDRTTESAGHGIYTYIAWFLFESLSDDFDRILSFHDVNTDSICNEQMTISTSLREFEASSFTT